MLNVYLFQDCVYLFVSHSLFHCLATDFFRDAELLSRFCFNFRRKILWKENHSLSRWIFFSGELPNRSEPAHVFLTPKLSSGLVECSFGNHAGKFLHKLLKSLAQTTRKFFLLMKTFSSRWSRRHAKHKFFETVKIRKKLHSPQKNYIFHFKTFLLPKKSSRLV